MSSHLPDEEVNDADGHKSRARCDFVDSLWSYELHDVYRMQIGGFIAFPSFLRPK